MDSFTYWKHLPKTARNVRVRVRMRVCVCVCMLSIDMILQLSDLEVKHGNNNRYNGMKETSFSQVHTRLVNDAYLQVLHIVQHIDWNRPHICMLGGNLRDLQTIHQIFHLSSFRF